MRVVGILILTCFCMVPAQAWAQKKTISWNERGVLAFYKVSGKKPNFEAIIKSSKDYKAMTQDAAKQFLQEELLRLQWGLGTFNPEKDYLKIQTKLLTSIIEDNGKFYLASNFPGKSALDPPYFPYNVENTWVALMLKNIENFMLLEISAEEQNRIAGFLPSSEEKHELQVDIVYRALTGDPNPIQIDGVEQHMMLGDIAQFSLSLSGFHQSSDKLLWEYIAPWYLSGDKQELLKMLESP